MVRAPRPQLNGRPPPERLVLLPDSVLVFTSVILFCFAFLALWNMGLDAFFHEVSLALICSFLYSMTLPFLLWLGHDPGPPEPLLPQRPRDVRRRHRWLLRQAMLIVASLPVLTTGADAASDRAYVASTSRLDQDKLQALKNNVARSPTLQPIELPFLSTFPILMDTGASCCTSPSVDDFEPGTLKDLPNPQTMKGIGGNLEIKQMGILRFNCLDDQGNQAVIRCPGFYSPMLQMRLFSPQMFFSTSAKGGSYLVKEDRSVLCFKSGQTITMSLDPVTKLFYTHCFHDVQKQADHLAQSLGLTHESNTNLSQGQKRLLRWHHALVHIGFTTVRHIAKLGWLGTKGLSLGDPKIPFPLCGSCQYGKGHKRSTQATRTTTLPQAQGAITKDKLEPGDLVSMDHVVIRQPGRRFESRGRESVDRMFHGGTIFVDAASGRIKVKFQRGLTAAETLQSKIV